jgi:hypothetical protein
MDPLPTLVADVKSALSAANPLNAGSLIKGGIKVCLESKTLLGLPHDQRAGILAKAIVTALTELKEKELAGCSDEKKAAVNDRYAHLTLVAESGIPSVIETVYEIFSGKLNLSSLVSQVKPASWFSWFSCLATSAVSAAAATGLVSEKQAADAASVVKKIEEAPKKIDEMADKVEAVLAEAKAAVPALAPVVDAVAAVVDKVEAAAEAVVPVPVAAPAPVPVPAPVETAQSNPVETVHAPAENKQ